MNTTAPHTPPTAAAAAATEGMTLAAYRTRVEWSTLLSTTACMVEAERIALDGATGRVIPTMARRMEALRRSRFQTVLALLNLGVPAEVIATGTAGI